MGYMTKKEYRTAENAIFKIFISYSSNDLDKIKPILDQLSTKSSDSSANTSGLLSA
jgi:hypothetical protein